MVVAVKKTVIRLLTLPPLFGWMNRVMNTAPVILTLHRRYCPESGILGHDPLVIKQYIEFLRRHGYRFVTLDVIDAWLRGEDERDMTNTVAFTLDDGYKDQAEMVREVFQPQGVPVSLFVITDFIDGKDWPWDAKINWLVFNGQRKRVSLTVAGEVFDLDLGSKHTRLAAARKLRRTVMYTAPDEVRRIIGALAEGVGVPLPAQPPECHLPLSWDEARELEHAGNRFGSHSVNHYNFSTLGDDEADYQLAESRRRIRAELRQPLTVFCYPIGARWDYTGREILRTPEAGYTSAVTTCPGVVTRARFRQPLDRFAIPRYGCPDDVLTAIQYVSGIERAKDMVCAHNPTAFIDARYGSRRGFARAMGARLHYLAGRYRHYTRVDWSQVRRLVFVCKGNVCRSPFAAAVATAKGLTAISYGLRTDQGTQVNPIATRIALRFGINMSMHRTCELSIDDLRAGDLVVGMEPSHCDAVQSLNLPPGVQVTLIGLWSSRKAPFIQDPYGLSDDYFDSCYRIISDAVSGISDRISRN